MQDIETAMAVVESLGDYRRSRYSYDEGLEDSHTTGGGEEVSPNTAMYGKGKPYNWDKGKGK